MDLENRMVIIDDKIVTDKIVFCNYNSISNTYKIKYKNSNKVYNFSQSRVKDLRNSKLVNLKEYKFYVNNKLLSNVKEVYEFLYDEYYYYHVIFNDISYVDYTQDKIKKVSNNYYNIIDYMKKVSEVVSLKTEDGNKLLCKQMEKVEIDDLDAALVNYLGLSKELLKENDVETLIFPFGCNSSQYDAVENAIYNKISVIEGPPGTGKTQTILNIIANIIIRGMNCQVVSNNNSAIQNIDEKLKNYDLSFFVALLGKKENKDIFIEQQNTSIPDFRDFENIDIQNISNSLRNCSETVKKFYNIKKEIANLKQCKNELELEYNYFNELVKSQKITLVNNEKFNLNKVKVLWNELISIDKISFWDKVKYIFLYKIGSFNFYNNDINVILKSLQNQIYLLDLNNMESEIKEKEKFLYDNKEVEKKFIDLSMEYFKKYLSLKYQKERKKYSSTEIWKESEKFLDDYPVILSTTYSSRSTFNNNVKFDYIIMDESSQIDVVTGVLALSSAKYAVIIGDEKQLPNVVKDEISKQTSIIFNKYKLDKGYAYSLNSFLSSVKNIIPNIQVKMLVEHYRCHPKIINFCNKKFYNNELVIMTNDNNESDVIKVIRTNKGNHARDNSSQRQVDIIKDILREESSEDIGIITPYNNQVDLISENFGNVEVSTVHKFQGREKDTIIISTVEDDISDFVGDSKILNVAISRAKNHLYFIVTGNVIKNSNINDFIDYVDYNNMEIVNSQIYSSFDLLYKQYELERLEFFKKHNRIGKWDSENIIYYLIKDIINDYDNLGFHFHQSLNDLINDKSLLNVEEMKYASHHNTHIDFYIYKKIGDKPVLAIEVDGYKNHKKGTLQFQRDKLKNSILEKYNIPLIRLKTNGSGEEKIIRDKLDEIIKIKF